ncbi:dihydrofolate reductase [Mycoplasmatota bacterium WC44]
MISIIVAHDKNRLIGKNNSLPWHYSEDLKYFKNTTLNQTILMGSSTLQSIIDFLGKPLPKRHTLLLTRKNESPYDVEVVNSIEDVVEEYKDSSKELFICGGKSVYEQFMQYTDRLYITHIDAEHEGDTYFPEYELNDWNLIKETKIDNLYFCVYERK